MNALFLLLTLTSQALAQGSQGGRGGGAEYLRGRIIDSHALGVRTPMKLTEVPQCYARAMEKIDLLQPSQSHIAFGYREAINETNYYWVDEIPASACEYNQLRVRPDEKGEFAACYNGLSVVFSRKWFQEHEGKTFLDGNGQKVSFEETCRDLFIHEPARVMIETRLHEECGRLNLDRDNSNNRFTCDLLVATLAYATYQHNEPNHDREWLDKELGAPAFGPLHQILDKAYIRSKASIGAILPYALVPAGVGALAYTQRHRLPSFSLTTNRTYKPKDLLTAKGIAKIQKRLGITPTEGKDLLRQRVDLLMDRFRTPKVVKGELKPILEQTYKELSERIRKGRNALQQDELISDWRYLLSLPLGELGVTSEDLVNLFRETPTLTHKDRVKLWAKASSAQRNHGAHYNWSRLLIPELAKGFDQQTNPDFLNEIYTTLATADLTGLRDEFFKIVHPQMGAPTAEPRSYWERDLINALDRGYGGSSVSDIAKRGPESEAYITGLFDQHPELRRELRSAAFLHPNLRDLLYGPKSEYGIQRQTFSAMASGEKAYDGAQMAALLREIYSRQPFVGHYEEIHGDLMKIIGRIPASLVPALAVLEHLPEDYVDRSLLLDSFTVLLDTRTEGLPPATLARIFESLHGAFSDANKKDVGGLYDSFAEQHQGTLIRHMDAESPALKLHLENMVHRMREFKPESIAAIGDIANDMITYQGRTLPFITYFEEVHGWALGDLYRAASGDPRITQALRAPAVRTALQGSPWNAEIQRVQPALASVLDEDPAWKTSIARLEDLSRANTHYEDRVESAARGLFVGNPSLEDFNHYIRPAIKKITDDGRDVEKLYAVLPSLEALPEDPELRFAVLNYLETILLEAAPRTSKNQAVSIATRLADLKHKGAHSLLETFVDHSLPKLVEGESRHAPFMKVYLGELATRLARPEGDGDATRALLSASNVEVSTNTGTTLFPKYLTEVRPSLRPVVIDILREAKSLGSPEGCSIDKVLTAFTKL